jgi:hypothetical protein
VGCCCGAVTARWVRSDDEVSLCSSSSAAVNAISKRSYRKIIRSMDNTDSDTGTEVSAVIATAFLTGLEPLETVAELLRAKVGYMTADLGAEIMREIKEIERIASVSRHLNDTCLRRLRLSSRRARESSAELQQRTVTTSAIASTMAGLCDGAAGDDDVWKEDINMESKEGEGIEKDREIFRDMNTRPARTCG